VPNQGLIFSKNTTKTIGNTAKNHGKNRSIEKDRALLQLLFNSVAAVKSLSSKREGFTVDYRILWRSWLGVGPTKLQINYEN
jgi:hypothetical protein